MNSFEVDRYAEKALTSPLHESHLTEDTVVAEQEAVEAIGERIMNIPFDCTPNWGIRGLGPPRNYPETNWYRRDPAIESRYQERIRNIDYEKLGKIIANATADIIEQDATPAGFSIYGSYLYREAYAPPEDLDVLVFLKSEASLAYDALRYRTRKLKDIFIDQTLPTPRTDDIGLTIISEDEFNPTNKSLVMTDAALLDVSTTYSVGRQVESSSVPPFVLIHNAEKVLRWGLSVIQDRPTSTLSRIDEALRMREFVASDFPELKLPDFELDSHLPRASTVFRGMGENELGEIAGLLIRQFQTDEVKVRDYVANKIVA